MTRKRDEPFTTGGLQYPVVDLFTGGMIMPLMFMNAAATWYLLSLNAPLAFMEAWTKASETTSDAAAREKATPAKLTTSVAGRGAVLPPAAI
jgi:hypothetical protein